MKILYLITGLGGGGAEKVVADLAQQMSQRGHEVKVAYLKGQVIVRPENPSIELVYLGLETLTDTRKAYQNYKKLLLRFSPDVVHAHMVHANIFARISRQFYDVPRLICTAHSNNEGGKVRMLAYRLTHTCADLTTNVSQAASKNFENLGAVPKGGIQTVYNGIDLNKFKRDEQLRAHVRSSLNIADDEIMLLAVGRLHEAKDYPNLLNALSLILKKNNITKKVKLVIAGEGEQKSILEQKIQALKIQDHVQLIGRRNDVPQLMSAADLFVLSSSFEGFGLVVAEAMACETYVVATDCGGVQEVMGGFGSLVNKSDSDALAIGIEKVLTKNIKEIVDNNHKALNYVRSNLALDSIVEKWIELYES